MAKKRIGIITSLILMGIFLLAMGPFDVFTHGFYPNEIDVAQIADADKLGQIKVNAQDSVIVFSPQEKHFAGVELFLVNQNPDNGGIMTMLINDSKGRLIDEVEIELSKVKDSSWYKTYVNADLKKGEQYTARFTVSGTDTPSFLLVNEDYLGSETISGNILISYAYAHSTFSLQEKVLLFMLLISLLGVILYFLSSSDAYRRISKYVLLFSILTVGMAWNFTFNSFDNQNKDFSDFQAVSEVLVTGPILAERDGDYFSWESDRGYGLGRYYDLKGIWENYGLSYTTDDNWLSGYSRTDPAIMVDSNAISERIAVAGNFIRFSNGEEYQITKIEDDGSNIVIRLNADRPLSEARNGSIDKSDFFDADHNPLAKTLISGYYSQYGLQGKIFKHMARHMSEEEAIPNLNLICALATAAVFVVIVFFLAAKYNSLFAGCFYITLALSPWVVNFARNLYWVEFTWFIPMAVGLICSMKAQSVKWRIGCYAAAFISITVKCLCGYEYISTVMMGLIAFMVIDFLLAVVRKDIQTAKLFFKAIFILGVAALAGFMVAILIHATLRGEGNLLAGIKSIIVKDVLRRTYGADLNNYAPKYWASINASVWETYCKYFHFSTEIITGVAGNLFPVLCIIPLAVFVYEFSKGKCDYQSIFMYLYFFLTAQSWFCLAKSHSYIHTHMNYVMWYFGFIQTCLYVIISRIVNAVRTDRGKIQEKG